jgi:hypothetical protein
MQLLAFLGFLGFLVVLVRQRDSMTVEYLSPVTYAILAFLGCLVFLV